MSLGTFNKCCVCLDLRTGSFIIAYLLLVGQVIKLIHSSFHLAGMKLALEEHQSLLEHHDLEFFKLIYSFVILILVFELLITIALVNGLHKKIQDQVQMFYVGGFVFEVLKLIILTVIIMRYCHMMVKAYGAWQWVTFSVEILGHVLFFYFLSVIRSYYFLMRKEDESHKWNVFANSPIQLKINK